MIRFFKRLVFVVFFLCLFLLTIFYVGEQYYVQWLIALIVVFFALIFLSFAVIKTKKKELMLHSVLDEFKSISKQEEEVKSDAMEKEYVCPACKAANNFWTFLENGKCKNCSSELWSAKVDSAGEDYGKLFRKQQKINGFYVKTPYKIVKKVKKLMLFER